MRLITYNIHGGTGTDGRHDYARIGHFLAKNDIDIALLQEMDTRPEERNTQQDIEDISAGHFNYFLAAPTIAEPSGWYGNALLSRYPIVKHTIIDISQGNRQPRNILETFIETPKGRLHVVNTHKGLRRFERFQQMARLHALLQRESDVPLVVGGDINQWYSWSKPLRRLNELLQRHQTQATFPTAFPLFQLDRLWSRPAELVKQVTVIKTEETRVYSDHYPILAELDFDAPV